MTCWRFGGGSLPHITCISLALFCCILACKHTVEVRDEAGLWSARATVCWADDPRGTVFEPSTNCRASIYNNDGEATQSTLEAKLKEKNDSSSKGKTFDWNSQNDQYLYINHHNHHNVIYNTRLEIKSHFSTLFSTWFHNIKITSNKNTENIPHLFFRNIRHIDYAMKMYLWENIWCNIKMKKRKVFCLFLFYST